MTMVLSGSNGITFPDSTDQGTGYANGIGFRNRIINGDMRIDQRNAGASVSGNGDFPVDRFRVFENTSATYTAQQSTTAPSNYSNSLLFTVGSAASATAAQYAGIETRVEGFNVADISFGTSACKPVTLSFVVRSSVTGTYCVALTNNADNRVYVAEYTINSANTFEAKSITAPAITSGTWLTNNETGLKVWFDLGSGSDRNTTASVWQTNGPFSRTSNQTDFVNNSGATFYITGVQLEVGSVATPFERRPYGTELSLCQRYYCKTFSTGTAPAQNTGYTGALGAISINAGSATALWVNWQFPVEMRAVPTITTFSPTAANSNWYSPAGPSSTTTAGSFGDSTRFANIYNSNAPAAGADIVYYIQATASIEL